MRDNVKHKCPCCSYESDDLEDVREHYNLLHHPLMPDYRFTGREG